MSKSYQNLSIWEGLPLKLAILVPTRDMVHSHFSYSIAQLLSTTRELGIDAYLFYDSSTILLNQRERLIEKAKEINLDEFLEAIENKNIQFLSKFGIFSKLFIESESCLSLFTESQISFSIF